MALPSRPFRPAPSSSPLLAHLSAGCVEAGEIARRAGIPEAQAFAALEALAWDGLLDAQDPPEPMGREHLGWFVLPRATPVACQPL